MRLRPRHVRTRLTLWYVGVLSGVLALYVGFTLVFLQLSQRRELDQRLHEEFETVEDLLATGPDGSIRMGGHGDEESERLVEVWSADGRLLYRSDALQGETLGRPPANGTPLKRPLASVTLADETPLRVVSRPHRVGGRDVLVRVALSEERQRHESRELLLGLLLALPMAIAIAAVGGHWLAGRALGPLDRMARHAEQLTAEKLGARLPVENPDDELGHLARVFNLSLARIEESFAQLRRFTADASHELRTPLTAIRTVGEVALQDPQNPDRYREAIGSMLEEADRLSRLVGSLLVLSRADAAPALRRQELRLVELVKDSASLLEVLADEKGQRIEVDGDAGITTEGDGLVLRQALINLIDNAIKYSARGSLIRIAVLQHASGAMTIGVSDQGPGIHEADRPRVFERFYRVGEARSREDGGTGLGLSIALSAVRAHGGRIELESQEGLGSTFRIVLPGASGRAAGRTAGSQGNEP
jgi:heavy metal sensor kinase